MVVTEALKNGRKGGIEVAISPIISEPPIILFVLVILFNLTGNSIIMAMISLAGACYLAYLGLSNLRVNVKEAEDHLVRASSMLKGITTNLLNPNAYMFWLTIGGPRVLERSQVNVSAAVLFILGFYMTLVGSKITVAVVVDKSKAFVESRYYTRIIQVLGIVLIVLALIFVGEALEFLGIL